MARMASAQRGWRWHHGIKLSGNMAKHQLQHQSSISGVSIGIASSSVNKYKCKAASNIKWQIKVMTSKRNGVMAWRNVRNESNHQNGENSAAAWQRQWRRESEKAGESMYLPRHNENQRVARHQRNILAIVSNSIASIISGWREQQRKRRRRDKWPIS